jgi:hypothetical protein
MLYITEITEASLSTGFLFRAYEQPKPAACKMIQPEGKLMRLANSFESSSCIYLTESRILYPFTFKDGSQS